MNEDQLAKISSETTIMDELAQLSELQSSHKSWAEVF